MLQTSQKINLREERDFGEKLNATFIFIKANFKPLSKAILLYVSPVAILAGIFSGLYQSRLFQQLTGGGPYNTMGEYTFFNQVTSLNYIITMFLTLMAYVVVALTVYGFMVAYMDEEGKVTPAAVWEHIKRNLVQATYASIALGIVCFLSVFLLGLGIYLSVVLSIFLIVMVREETGFIDTIERCFYLIKGNWWATFGLIFVVSIVQGVLGWFATLPAGVIILLRVLQLPGANSELLLILTSTITTILTTYTYCITMLALGFQYFNLVEQKDGIGLMEQVDQIGHNNTNTAANEGEF
ncbi:hypothetical protein POKO110462_16075 [Pontibacter korlensis]|uniref:Glycerophosphoryl diester phosphodiesterase membrane domain-containing protein n=1 Tax=Pontibacter korlensis TaxID=400092 RepID=A0A0E3ZJ98_9BACT|nr:hypothetical protein [Pontibacter korlensis]AKD05089.1 hypothetical protein PKOR_20930 [Pontibacter korlensis]